MDKQIEHPGSEDSDIERSTSNVECGKRCALSILIQADRNLLRTMGPEPKAEQFSRIEF
jgi:hypothetical protein